MPDSYSSRDTSMRDDAVGSGVKGTDNASYMSDILEHCAKRRVPFIVKSNGHGGRFFIGSTVSIPSNCQLWFERGRLAFFGGTNLQMFNGANKSDIHIKGLRVEGDSHGGHRRARDNSKLGVFSNANRVLIEDFDIRDYFGDWGFIFDGQNQAQQWEMRNGKILNSVCATSIYMSGLCDRPIVRNVELSGDKLRLNANGVTVDDRILMAFANQANDSRKTTFPVIDNVRVSHTSASGVKVGNFRQGRFTNITAYCCAFPVMLYASAPYPGGDGTQGSSNTIIDNVVIDGSREAGSEQAAVTLQNAQDVTISNVKVRNSAAAAAETGAARFVYGLKVEAGCEDVVAMDFDVQRTRGQAFSLQGKNQTLIRPKATDCDIGAVVSVGPDPSGFLRLVEPRFESLFAANQFPKRAIEINGATNLDEIWINGLQLVNGIYAPGSVSPVFNNTKAALHFEK
jgi:hypothetical protein